MSLAVGVVCLEARVSSPASFEKAENVRFLVDGGAVYSLVPRDVLRRLGITPHSVRRFLLANGESMDLQMGTAAFEYEGKRGDGLVVFGEPGATPLLGATTLEGFGYILDP